MKVAALDLGTNTFLLLIAEVSSGAQGSGAARARIERVLHDEVRIVRLGQGVHEAKRFHPEALARADEAFTAFAKTIAQHGVTRVRACATSAARDVANGATLLELGKKHGIPIEIISGEREAELTFAGTIRADAGEPNALIDVGGGSTEIIFGLGSKIEARASMDVGSVRLTELFVTSHPVPFDELQRMTSYIDDRLRLALAKLPKRGLPHRDVGTSSKIIAVAGTPTTLATLDQGLPFESERVDGYGLSIDRLRHWVDRLAGMKVEERQVLAGMEPKRADVIVAGALILLLTAEALGAKNLEVSIRGLRFGVAIALAAESAAK